jgi:hypothetical protein
LAAPLEGDRRKREDMDMRAFGAFVIFVVGLVLAALMGAAAGLSSFSCSGGAIGEGCSGGSWPLAVIVFLVVAVPAVLLARAVAISGTDRSDAPELPPAPEDDPWANMRPIEDRDQVPAGGADASPSAAAKRGGRI